MAPNSALFFFFFSALGKTLQIIYKNQVKYEQIQSEEFRVGTSRN